MSRREQIERIIVGSILTNGSYLREVCCLSREDFHDLLTREIFEMLPELVRRAGDDMPLEVLFRDEEIKVEHGGNFSELCVQAIELSCTSNFDVNKCQYNLDALIDYYFCAKPYRPTQVEFRDYVSQFIKYNHGATGNAA